MIAQQVLIPVSMPELLATVAVIAMAVAVILVTLAIVGPSLYVEARSWFEPEPPPKVVDLEQRRRELGVVANFPADRRPTWTPSGGRIH